MGYRSLSISLPTELLQLVELVQVRESRSRSEVMREALRMYFEQRNLLEDPLPGDLEAIREGKEALERGDYVTLKSPEDIRRALGLKTK